MTKMATKRKHHEVTLKVKYETLKNLKRVGLIKVLQTNSVFLVVLLLLGRIINNNIWSFSKLFTETTKSENLNRFAHIDVTTHWCKPCWSGLHQCVVATTFQSVVPFFWRKLMDLLRHSIQPSNRCLLKRMLFLSLCNTLHHEDTSPAYFLKTWLKLSELL